VFVPQLWRTFESAVYLREGRLSVAGVYRTDLPAAFNPNRLANYVKTFNLPELINEFG
jgi:hypothetical protein